MSDQTLALLVSDDPRKQARRLLAYLIARSKAASAVVVNVEGDELRTFVGEVPLARLTALQSRWKAEAKELRSGHAVLDDDDCVVPLLEGRDLVGLLFIKGGVGVEVKSPTVMALSAALKAAREDAYGDQLDEPVEVIGAELERYRLMTALERNEWNIALVARLMRVTRLTIYLRMRRYKIPRQRVPKILKPAPSVEEDA